LKVVDLRAQYKKHCLISYLTSIGITLNYYFTQIYHYQVFKIT